MERIDLETWFAHHPDSIHQNTDELLDECEREIRGHARRDAWIHAREIAEESLHRFERIFGLPASDTFVTREVCHEIARELKHHEPHPDDALGEEWVRRNLLRDLDPEARRMITVWMKELADKEEHTAWTEIVYFTDHLAKELINKAHLDNRLEWNLDNTYPRIAARIVRMMIRELEAHAARDLNRPLESMRTH